MHGVCGCTDIIQNYIVQIEKAILADLFVDLPGVHGCGHKSALSGSPH